MKDKIIICDGKEGCGMSTLDIQIKKKKVEDVDEIEDDINGNYEWEDDGEL